MNKLSESRSDAVVAWDAARPRLLSCRLSRNVAIVTGFGGGAMSVICRLGTALAPSEGAGAADVCLDMAIGATDG